jgi:hypothetical protein
MRGCVSVWVSRWVRECHVQRLRVEVAAGGRRVQCACNVRTLRVGGICVRVRRMGSW